MFSFLNGIVDYIDSDAVELDVNGIGFRVNMPARSLLDVPNVGEHVKLYTHLSVREDAVAIFGFLSRDELSLFEKLITVSGIGPKGGQAILSEFEPNTFRYLIESEDAKAISKAPGIGAKTAQRLILELKGKLSVSDDLIISELRKGKPVTLREDVNLPQVADACLALEALGYSASESRKAIHAIEGLENMDSGEILGAALKNMF